MAARTLSVVGFIVLFRVPIKVFIRRPTNKRKLAASVIATTKTRNKKNLKKGLFC